METFSKTVPFIFTDDRIASKLSTPFISVCARKCEVLPMDSPVAASSTAVIKMLWLFESLVVTCILNSS